MTAPKYIFESTNMGWEDANAYCKTTYGTQLATITSDKEASEARDIMADGGSEREDVPVYIGLSKLSGSWEWASGQQCDYDGISDCEDDPRWRWDTAEPNGSGDCAYLTLQWGYTATSCSNTYSFLCDAGTVITFCNLSLPRWCH